MGINSSKSIKTKFECYYSNDNISYDAMIPYDLKNAYNQSFVHFKINKNINRYTNMSFKININGMTESIFLEDSFYNDINAIRINYFGVQLFEYNIKLIVIKHLSVLVRFDKNNKLHSLVLQKET